MVKSVAFCLPWRRLTNALAASLPGDTLLICGSILPWSISPPVQPVRMPFPGLKKPDQHRNPKHQRVPKDLESVTYCQQWSCWANRFGSGGWPPGPSPSSVCCVGGHMTHRASLPSFSFLFSLLITSKNWITHQYMLLTWLLPWSPFALSSADPGPRLQPHRGLWWWIAYQRSYWWILYGRFCIVLAYRDNNGGPVSCWHLIVVVDHDRGGSWWWILMVDPDGFSGQWLWTIVASDHVGGSWDYDYNKTASYIIFLLRYSTITDNNPSIHWPSVMLQSVYSNQCCKYPYLADVLLYTGHLLHFCPSWERDPSHVVLSEVSTFFLPC